MRQLGPLLLVLALAGCSSSGSLFQREEPRPAPLTSQAAPSGAPPVPANRENLSPAASAAAPKTDGSESAGELMDCVTESSKSRGKIQTEVVCAFQRAELTPSKVRAWLIRLEAAKRPSRHETEQQKRYGRADQQNRYRKQVTGTESAADAIKSQIDDPRHYPRSGQQKPDAQQAAPPIYLCNLVDLFGFSARNSKALHHILLQTPLILIGAFV
jgi:hypothetical protein